MNVAVRELQTLFTVGSLGRLSDEQLLDRFVEQREDAVFEAIVRRHGPMVWGVCRRVLWDRHDAEDAFQATFIVLARKAASVKIREKLGHWLYGVAYQTAMKAKSMRAKRRMREVLVTEVPEPIVVSGDLRDAFAESLDWELSRLPDKYRIPIVLCGLEGRTLREAAERLGWPIGTVSSRLSRARSMLAERLTRRGLLLSGGSLAVLLAQESASASAGMPTKLIVSTARAASQIAAWGAVPAGVVSAEVAAMTHGVLKMMLLSKIKIATAMLMIISALAVGGTGLAYQSQANGPAQKEDLQRLLDEKEKEKDLGLQMHPDLPNGHHMVGLPSVASWGPGRLDFLVTGDDGIVYHRYHEKGSFSPPEGWEACPALPGGHRVVGPPRMVSLGSGVLRFFVTGDDGVVRHRSWSFRSYDPEDGWKDCPIRSAFDAESGYINPFGEPERNKNPDN
jgi:RNA polymerase sigma factor (sigma-70 family)